MGQFPQIDHLGAAQGVTGSCHLLRTGSLNLLIDCGQAQGHDAVPSMTEWPVPPSEINFVFLTHAHIDHIGRLPELFRGGFAGQILTTPPTQALLRPMLEDALRLSHGENGERLSRHIVERVRSFGYGTTFALQDGVRFRLGRAGHILGSCLVHLEHPGQSWSVVFSGDLGGQDHPLLPDPDPPPACDLLVLESTYGDRPSPKRRDRLCTLGRVLSRSLADGGKVLIPSFALGRTQEILYELDRLDSDPTLADEFPTVSSTSKIPVFLDSPLGLKVTEIYQELLPFWDEEAKNRLRRGDNPLDFDRLFSVARYGDHRRLLEYPGSCIIIAGSGMCSGGRIVDHLKACIEDPRTDVLFVGYQAKGTPGRQILDHAGQADGYVELEGERFAIRAAVHSLTGFSAHAHQDELIAWVQSMGTPDRAAKPGAIRLVHGERDAKTALMRALVGLGYRVEIPT